MLAQLIDFKAKQRALSPAHRRNQYDFLAIRMMAAGSGLTCLQGYIEQEEMHDQALNALLQNALNAVADVFNYTKGQYNKAKEGC